VSDQTDWAIAYGFELTLAIPAAMRHDIYYLHQAVWRHVKSSQRLQRTPTILFRHDDGVLRVRVTDSPVVRSMPVRSTFVAGRPMALDVRLALWRNVHPSNGCPKDRARDIIENHGLQLHDMTIDCSTACGYKAKTNADIELPVARVKARVTVADPNAVADAWSNGIGRGRRFGFGMMILQ
jgi:hypothetical protein